MRMSSGAPALCGARTAHARACRLVLDGRHEHARSGGPNILPGRSRIRGEYPLKQAQTRIEQSRPVPCAEQAAWRPPIPQSEFCTQDGARCRYRRCEHRLPCTVRDTRFARSRVQVQVRVEWVVCGVSRSRRTRSECRSMPPMAPELYSYSIPRASTRDGTGTRTQNGRGGWFCVGDRA